MDLEDLIETLTDNRGMEYFTSWLMASQAAVVYVVFPNCFIRIKAELGWRPSKTIERQSRLKTDSSGMGEE